jgi:hypothetical protein
MCVPEHEDDSRVGCGFMQRTRGEAEAGSEVGVELEKAVRRHAWFRRKPGSSRVSESGRLQAMLLQLRPLLHLGGSGGRAARA